MATPNDNQLFYTEMEYMMQKYFNEHCASMVNSQVKYFHDRQVEEFEAAWQKNTSPFVPMNVQVMNARRDIERNGEWNNKTSEDLMAAISKKFESDPKIAGDINYLAGICRVQMRQQMGEDEYARLSKGYPSGDLATDYVSSRFAQMTIGQLAKSRMPKSSFEYIMKNGFSGSLVGTLVNKAANVPSSELDKRIEALADDMYDASWWEKAGVMTTAVAVDGVVTGGAGAARSATVKGGTAIARAFGGASKAKIIELARPAFSTAADSGAKATVVSMGKGGVLTGARKYGLYGYYGIEILEPFLSNGQVDADKVVASVSLNLFGSQDTLDACKASTVELKANRSKSLHQVNDGLQQKVKVPSYHVPFSPTMQKTYQKNVSLVHNGDAERAMAVFPDYCKLLGVTLKDGEIPAWMLEKSSDELLRMSDYYMGLAMEINRCGSKTAKVSGKDVTKQDAVQMGYDYARAAALQLQRAEEEARAEERRQEEETESRQSSSRRQQMDTAQSQWGGLMEALGLKGAGDLSQNLGYILAMLPDMIYGMLTGKSTNLKIENNIFPLMAIFGGLFIKNPLLKFLLIGLGAVNILNKGFGEVSGRDQTQAAAKSYRQYPDEPVSPRVTFHDVRGNQVILDIDGRAEIVTVSNETMEAYRQGALSKGALCNAILREYDAFERESRRQYDLDNRASEEREVVRLGVG